MASAVVLLAGCQSAQSTSSTADPAEVNFTTNAYQIIEFDRQEGTLAQTQATTPRVKDLAAKQLGEANEFAAQLTPVAASANIKLPDVLRNDLRVRLSHMRLQQGLDFDRTYVNDQIASHQEAIMMQDQMMGSPGASPQFKALIQKAQGLLRENLAALQNLQMQMQTGPRRARG